MFNEELGGVIQIRSADYESIFSDIRNSGLESLCHAIGTPDATDNINFYFNETAVLSDSRTRYQRAWSETSYHMQKLRDNPECAQQEYDQLLHSGDPGLRVEVGYDIHEDISAAYINTGIRPEIAVLREQGVNGQIEMAAAFNRAGFKTFDVHMSDIIEGRVSLEQFKGIVACGGFSYGDVLGAGEGWAKSILFNSRAREQFEAFFNRDDTFGLGVCNGCQMMSNLHELIPGTSHWPHFVKNHSEQFEARTVMVEILNTPSLFFTDMQGSRMPISVAHGEGRAELKLGGSAAETMQTGLVCLQYVDNDGFVTEKYPANPNGSPQGITGLCNQDGRFTIMMPHPERVFREVQNTWQHSSGKEDAAWMRMFRNARKWLN